MKHGRLIEGPWLFLSAVRVCIFGPLGVCFRDVSGCQTIELLVQWGHFCDFLCVRIMSHQNNGQSHFETTIFNRGVEWMRALQLCRHSRLSTAFSAVYHRLLGGNRSQMQFCGMSESVDPGWLLSGLTFTLGCISAAGLEQFVWDTYRQTRCDHYTDTTCAVHTHLVLNVT